MVHEGMLVEAEPVQGLERCRPRILIIDDDVDQAETMRIAFNGQGYDALTAHTYQSGLTATRLHAPQLVIMDVRLPDGDGLRLCQQLSDDAATCQVPVIILSGMERSDIVRNARAAGCRFYLRKPYDPNALLLLAESAMRDQSSWQGAT